MLFRSEEVEGNGASIGDKAGKEASGLLGLGDGGSGVRCSEDDLDEGGRRGGKLRRARCEEDQAGGVEPVAEHVDGENGLCVVVPMGEAGGGELVGRGSAQITQGVAFLLVGATHDSNLQPGPKGRSLVL